MTTHVRTNHAVDEYRDNPDRLTPSVDLDHLDFVGDSGSGAFDEKRYSRSTLVRTAGVTAMVGIVGTIVFRKYFYPGSAPDAEAGTSNVGIAAVGAKPGAGNTGVPDGTLLTVYSGDMSVTAPGAVIQSSPATDSAGAAPSPIRSWPTAPIPARSPETSGKTPVCP